MPGDAQRGTIIGEEKTLLLFQFQQIPSTSEVTAMFRECCLLSREANTERFLLLNPLCEMKIKRGATVPQITEMPYGIPANKRKRGKNPSALVLECYH